MINLINQILWSWSFVCLMWQSCFIAVADRWLRGQGLSFSFVPEEIRSVPEVPPCIDVSKPIPHLSLPEIRPQDTAQYIGT